MNDTQRVPGRVRINTIPAGVPGLDIVLGGGIPEYSFNMIVGTPGTGKTTLAHQILFANASPEHPALYFTILGEPAIKMLRYQQQYSFFDEAKLDGAIRFINLSQEVLKQELGVVLERIASEVEAASPSIVVVDSFRTVIRTAASPPPLRDGEELPSPLGPRLSSATGMSLQDFVQRLALYLTSWQATTFLIGEYHEAEMQNNPVFTVADGILWLLQSVESNSIVRKLQVMKLRGQETIPGLHTFRITSAGLHVYPRTFGLTIQEHKPASMRRLSTGVGALDQMMGGGIPAGDSVLVAGPSGSGKTALATQFIAAGLRAGEPGVIAVFEERPVEYAGRASQLGMNLEESLQEGKLRILYLRPLDLSVDETLHEMVSAIEEVGAQRVVIDSMNGFEMALAPAFRQEFRESLYRMVGALTGRGVTLLTTVEVSNSFTDLRFSPHAISFLTDDILLQRYVEMEGELRKILMVVKMRGGAHSRDIREYEVTSSGIELGERRLAGYRGLITGVPERLPESVAPPEFAPEAPQ